MTWPVKVTNVGDYELKERFKGKEIVLKPGESRMFDRDEAVEYAAQYKPIETDGERNQKPSGYKKLAFDPGLYGKPTAEADPLLCHATGEKAMTKAELDQMIRDNAHLLADDKAKEALADETRTKMAAMEAQLAALLASQSAKKGGRPKKGANDEQSE